MSLNSMTGYGSGRAESPIGSVTVELRSVNSRFLDIQTRLPTDFTPYEPVVRQELQKKFNRGKIYVSVQFSPIPGATQQYELNGPLLEMLRSACTQQGETPALEHLLPIPGVVIMRPDASQQETLEKLLRRALTEAVEGFAAERAREGEALRQAIADMRAAMVKHLASVGEARSEVVQKYRDRLKERLEELLGPQASVLDPGRLEQEVAFFADKADISEEVIRLGAHLDRLEQLLNDKEGASKGRALDFLSQEILREVNTIGSKSRDLDITRTVLELKGLVESLKEQVANVE